jgi:hypothetical protein
MSHWADRYVGLPAVGPRPCWDLVRRVWAERLGFEMPHFNETDDPEGTIAREAVAFAPVPPGQEKEFDAVMMLVPHRTAAPGPRPFRLAETHIGVVAARGLVLHVEFGRTAAIDPLRAMKVSRILRGPWTGHVSRGVAA